jgi:membrane-associated phospholipid phosphatase
MKMLTNIVNPQGCAGALLICLIIAKDKLKMFNFFFFAACVTFFTMCLKSYIADPRPYFENYDIIPLEDYAEYGNPSGHVMMGYIIVAISKLFHKICHDNISHHDMS